MFFAILLKVRILYFTTYCKQYSIAYIGLIEGELSHSVLRVKNPKLIKIYNLLTVTKTNQLFLP